MKAASRSTHRAIVATLSLAAMAQATAALATTVVPMNLTTTADFAGQAISGRVFSMRSYWRSNPREIETEVVFKEVTYLKGAIASATSTFTLTVPGGKIGDMQMRVSGAPTLAVGETWVMFLLPTYKTFPVVGVSQGAFRVISDSNGVSRVYDSASRPVASISAKSEIQLGRRMARFNGVEPIPSARVRVTPRWSTTETAMSYDAFLDRLRPILSASRDHRMTQNAGRRIPVRYTAKQLKLGAGPVRASDAPRMHCKPRQAADSTGHLESRIQKARAGERR